MKRRTPKAEPPPHPRAPQGLKDQEELSGRSRQLLKEVNRKRGALSPSSPHSKTYGH
jgi:hypothetical protein